MSVGQLRRSYAAATTDYKNPCSCWPTRVCCHTLTKPDCLAPLQNSTPDQDPGLSAANQDEETGRTPLDHPKAESWTGLQAKVKDGAAVLRPSQGRLMWFALIRSGLKMAAKGPKGPTSELLANLETLWLGEFTRFCHWSLVPLISYFGVWLC